MRARNRLRVASAGLPFVYDAWIEASEREEELAQRCADALQQWTWQPRFSILLHSEDGYTSEEFDRSTRSVEAQMYPHWSITGKSETSIGAQIAAANADFIVALRVGDELSTAALFRFAEAARADRGASILYGDQDQLNKRGRRTRPWFKPSWNEELLLAQDYLSAAVAIDSNLAKKTLLTQYRPRSVPELVLAAAFGTNGPIVHLPHVLSHVRTQGDQQQWLDTVARYLRPKGVACGPGPFGTVKVDWPLPADLPLVSVIVPTKDKLGLLRACISSVLNRTDYLHFEIIIVDNGSVEPATIAYLEEIGADPRVEIVGYDSAYNFSAINNFAVGHARGSFLCFLNNDTEVVSASWLSELMRYAIRPEVGAVGAKLLYTNGTIQHAGVVVGIGGAAGHAHRFLPANKPGYFRMAHVAHFVSAVTAACLIVEKRKFTVVGGFDEEHLPVAFNDVDLCLKLETAGWRNVYVPHAVLVHHESVSRGKDSSPKNVERYRRELAVLQQRWGTKTYNDPLHNPNLDRHSETFVIAL